ncbi:MAG: AAA family ATPase [Acidimicrobiia bacterium]|nr:AAA family ATPase [Acidimicrobiia bacterium]
MTDIDLPLVAPQSVSTLLWELRQGATNALGIGPLGTGFEPLDSVLDGGFLPGEVVLLGGQPGVGKTVCALQWARNMSSSGRRVTFACFEHDEAALLNRLLVQELALVTTESDPIERLRAKALVRDLMLGLTTIDDAVAESPTIDEALTSLEVFSPNLQLLRASAQRTTPRELDEVSSAHLDAGGVLFVDYLQKLPVPSASSLEERVYRSVEIMKELAIAHQITVVALSAASSAGIGADRVRMDHLRGSDALAHECDLAILMNHKVTAAADRHLKFDLTQLDEARRRTIFSIEKNRRGEVDLHLEFVKDFSNFRFRPDGGFVTEALDDD